MKMEFCFSLKSLSLIFVFLSCFAATNASRPGFLFTRTRGLCTPQFWSSKREEWPRMVPRKSTISKVFGSQVLERYGSEITLMESTATNDEGNVYAKLLKQGTAALLNSYSRKGFPYSAWEVKTLVIQGLVSEKSAAKQAMHFAIANEGCD